jgi:alcohol dehydrogenase class IV
MNGHVRPALPAGRHRAARLDEVVYGRPFGEVVREVCERRGLARVGILGTRSLQGTLCAALERELGARHAVTFIDIAAHSPQRAVLAALHALRAAGADAVVAVGGGSVIDAAKAVRHGLRIGADDIETLFAPHAGAAARAVVPLIAVPTTLSGAEFTSMAGLSDASGRKQRLADPQLGPDTIVLDPAAALQTPMQLWASTGVRALDHAVETVCSDHCDVLSEAMALQSLPLLAEGLQAAAADPADLRARLQCQLGMWFACVGPAAGVPMGVSHGIGHILGAEHGLPHGITSCVVMRAAIAWNRPAVLERQQRIEAQLALPGQTLMEKVDALLQRLDLPRRLSDVGIGADQLAAIAERSMTDFFIPTNPRPVRSSADLLEILRQAA